VRELAAFSCLARLDGFHHESAEALAQNDLQSSARAVTDGCVGCIHRKIPDGTRPVCRARGDQTWMHKRLCWPLTEGRAAGAAGICRQSREVEAAGSSGLQPVTALVPLAVAIVSRRMTSKPAAVISPCGRRSMVRAVRAFSGPPPPPWPPDAGWFCHHLVATGGCGRGERHAEPILGGTMLGRNCRPLAWRVG